MRVGSADSGSAEENVEARSAGLEVATVPPPRPTCGKDHRGRLRAGLLALTSPLRSSAARIGPGGSRHAQSLRPGLYRTRSPCRRCSCRNGCDHSCRRELRDLWWSLRKRLSSSLRLPRLVLAACCGASQSATVLPLRVEILGSQFGRSRKFRRVRRDCAPRTARLPSLGFRGTA
jgi:hypothetical protein